MNGRAAASVLIVAGPTGSGKSALALVAAEAFDGVVINADSMQVYRELRVLTARPSAAEQARVPHRLYGFLRATESCSAGRWLRLARAEMESAFNAGRLPIVVGGTGLYLKALLEGLAEVPPVAAEIRAEAEALHAELGGERFRRELARLDPEAACRIAASDRQRLVRAFEVLRGTGRPLHEWQQRSSAAAPANAGRFATLALLPPRETLYPALDTRFDRMLANGAIDEVRALLALKNPSLPAMKAVGVREISAYLCGKCSLDQAAAASKQSTRRFAKRQFTWLRHQLRPEAVANEQYSESLRLETFAFIRQHLLTREA